MRYLVFMRRWWKDRACTVPGAGRKTFVCYAQSAEEARGVCKRLNRQQWGERERGPYGLAHEFEEAMKALGLASVRRGGPTLGRLYISAHPNDKRRRSLMAKAKTLWEGVTAGTSGTYIRPHLGGYEFGRWSRCRVTGGYRFERIGERSTMEACKAALAEADKGADRRVKQLNKRRVR